MHQAVLAQLAIEIVQDLSCIAQFPNVANASIAAIIEAAVNATEKAVLKEIFEIY
jgi:hypothetical protein